MKNLFLLLLLMSVSGLAFGQTTIPTCNAFDATGAPIYSTVGFPDTNGTALCTDYFGKANYANSPLPIGPLDLNGFDVLNGGNGYTAPVVMIDDYYGTPGAGGASCSANLTSGVITGLACSNAGAGYVAPVVTITDPTGSGATVLAKLDPTQVTGGMHKFLDRLPNLPVAVPDTATFPGSDFYVIELVQYTQKLHSDLPPTTLRGYCQAVNGTCVASYLGPLILATKNRPVRVLFKNMLPTGAGGNLFIPVDTTYMGAGMGPLGTGASPMNYAENRGTLHLHGGNTPWISDGTPHQWTVPSGEITPYQRGVSTRFVPDMWFDGSGTVIASCANQTTCTSVQNASNDPGPGAMTFYWTNQQGGRLMFYHDHVYGITRLNVYAGEAAGYLLSDPAEEDALAAASVPGTVGTTPDLAHIIPLVIQDKTFVPNPAQLAGQDPTWIWGSGSASTVTGNGDLWFPHVYTPNQNPADSGGANAYGRWDYGAWFFPPQTNLSAAGDGPLGKNTAVTIPCTSSAFPGAPLQPNAANNYQEGCPIIPNPSGTPEGFMDTPVINGMAYPVLHLAPAAYRFRILSAGNDRTLNLSIYLACGFGGSAAATNCSAPGATGTEVPMVPAVKGGGGTLGYVYPDQLDGRDGGVPDSSAAGPAWVEIGSEGGLLPKPAVIPPTPVGFEYGRRSITVLNVSSHGLLIGPAERADAVVDFSAYAGKTLILYNDAPAPVPAFDSRIDYFTGDPDQVQMGGAPSTLPGYGPNTRTLMQIVVDQSSPNIVPFSQSALQAQLPSIYATTTGALPAIVPEPTYPVASGANSATATYGRISDNTVTFTPIGSTAPITYNYEQKAIQELFTLDYGRMNATMGTELPLTNFQTQTTIPYGYSEWPTEILQNGKVQLWKLTHNGVDTHFVHFHLFNVQVINRIGWDGAVKLPDTNELGWKDTVRMNPLEDIVVAIQPFAQNLPWPLPDSVRSLDVTMPDGMVSPMISGIDPNTGNVVPGWDINKTINFGQEYVWHCHILGHEENDMMRPMTFQVAPPAPSQLTATSNTSGGVTVTWTDNSASESGFNLQRDIDPSFPNPVNLLSNASASSPNTAFGGLITYVDSAAPSGTVFYRVQSVDDFSPNAPLNPPFQPVVMTSNWTGAVPFMANPIAGTSPASLAFGNISVNTTSAAQTVILSNSGTTPLLFTIAVTGTNPGDFSLPTSLLACTGTLNPASTCNIDVAFTPSAVGARSATVTITSNDPVNGTLNVGLSGTGISNTALTITAPAIIYGQNGVVTVDAAAAGGTVTGIVSLSVDGAAPVSQTLSNGSATFDSTNVPALLTPTASGSPHALVANYAAQGAFLAGTGSATLTVTPAALTITASNGTMSYGGTVPSITPAFSGFVLGQTSAVLSAQPICSTTATATSAVGTYPSSCSGAVAANYAVTYVPGTVTVTSAALTITASSGTITYGGAVPAITPAYAGFLNGDTAAVLTTAPTCSTTATATSAVGSYPSTCSGAAAANYTIGYVAGTITVNAVTLSVTASSGSMTYAGTVPAISPSYSGFVNGQNVSVLTTPATCSTTATPTSAVGTYPSSCSGTVAPNYTVSYVNGTVTVSQAPLIITAGSASMTFGGAVPAITPGFSGFLNGDTAATLTTQPACGTAATSASPVGNYPSSCSGASAVNYAITNVPGTVTVGKATSSTVITANLPNPSILGQIVSISFSVLPQFTGTPTGSVTVSASGQSCTGALVAGVGSCNIAFSTGGSKTLTAAYAGDTNFVGSASAPATQVVSSIRLSTTSLLFGNQMVGTTSAGQIVTVANVGTAPVAISSIAWTKNFSDSTTCGTSLAPGRNCSITVRFVPTAVGVLTGTLTITDSDVPSTQVVSLTGTGVQPIATLSPTSYNFGTVLRRQRASFVFSLSNTGTAAMTINNISVGGPNANQFSRTTTCGGSLAVGATCNITVTFSPTQRGNFTATLNIADNAPGSPQTAALSGTGQ